jgi:hypothetical protein
MGATFGSLEAQRIMRERLRDADRLTQQALEERILTSEPARFLDAIASCLGDNVKFFNRDIGLEGDDAITFDYSNRTINIGKRRDPIILRKVIYFERTNEVLIRTQTIHGYSNKVEEERWCFAVERDGLRLGYKTSAECAEVLFKGFPDAYR